MLSREVSSDLTAEVGAPTELVIAVSVARLPGLTIAESLEVTVDGVALAVREVAGPVGTRWQVADAPPGDLRIAYRATVTGRADPQPVTDLDRILGVRPSRYVESDELIGPLIEATTIEAFAALAPAERIPTVAQWVRDRLEYAHGTTGPTDGLPEVLATGRGVCRDFAHLVAGILRATDLPARTVSVYAPELDPMDFHAVIEAALDDRWVVVDATGLAPRTGLLRIATGRDAADTAFLANDGSSLTLTGIRVTAAAEGMHPDDGGEVELR